MPQPIADGIRTIAGIAGMPTSGALVAVAFLQAIAAIMLQLNIGGIRTIASA